MRAFLYRHAILFVTLITLPYLFFLGFLCGGGHLAAPVGLLLAVLLPLLLYGAIARMYPHLLAECRYLLEEDCDPPAFLAAMDKLHRRHMPSRDRIVWLVYYAMGLDAAGRGDEAAALFRTHAPERAKMQPMMALLWDMARTSVAVGTADTDLEALSREITAYYHPLQQNMPVLHAAVQSMQDSLQDGIDFRAGRRYADMREKLAKQAGEMRAMAGAKHSLMALCMQLGRIYEKEEKWEQAGAMYRYVQENGNRLAIVQEAKEALCRLEKTEGPA